MANIAERAIGRLWDGAGPGSTELVRASMALDVRLPFVLTREQVVAYQLACELDREAEGPRSLRKRQLIRALGLTLIAELAERGEL